VSKIDKQRDRWNRIKSKGKKRYVLNILLIYVVFAFLFPTVQVFVLNKVKFPAHEIIIIYLMSLVVWSLLGLWIGIRTWKTNTRNFEK
jgi:K+-sensing histidine kinase KdpD